MLNIRSSLPGLLIATLSLATSMPAMAATRDIDFMANATGFCQAALPSFEGLIRKRPLAVQNEGSTTAFVTCSPTSFQSFPIQSFGYGVYFANRSGGTVTVNCTGVTGVDLAVSPVYMPKAVTISNNNSGSIYWSAADGLTSDYPFNVSCAIAPGVGITTIFINQTIDVGT